MFKQCKLTIKSNLVENTIFKSLFYELISGLTPS